MGKGHVAQSLGSAGPGKKCKSRSPGSFHPSHTAECGRGESVLLGYGRSCLSPNHMGSSLLLV